MSNQIKRGRKPKPFIAANGEHIFVRSSTPRRQHDRPPALAFASAITNSDAPSIPDATVYPMVMLLRVLVAQAIVLMFY